MSDSANAAAQRLLNIWASEGGSEDALRRLASYVGQGIEAWSITGRDAGAILAEVVRLAGFYNEYCEEHQGAQQTYNPRFDIEKLLEPLSRREPA